jgi:hypothetical protein
MTACRQRRSGCGPIRLLGRQPARRAGKNFPMLHWMQALSPAAATAKRQAEALAAARAASAIAAARADVIARERSAGPPQPFSDTPVPASSAFQARVR